MTPAFDQVGSKHNSASDPSAPVVAFVDCTVQESLCSKYKVQGYPTLKYFTPDTFPEGNAYESGRDFAALDAFVEGNLQPQCTVATPGKCSEKQAAFIEKMKGAAASEIAAQLSRLEKMRNDPMTPDLKKWLNQRIAILSELKTAKA